MKKIINLFLITLLYFALAPVSLAATDSSCNIGKILYEQAKYKPAFNHMKTIATYSNHCAEYYLGLMYFNGQGTKKNIELAYKYINLAIKGKYPAAIGFYDRQE